jgi:hypothetical protein
VYVFDNRMEFLVCATVFRQGINIIDALDRETFGDVKWLAEKMEARGLDNIRYLVRHGVYSAYINARDFIFTLAQLERLVRKKRTGPAVPDEVSSGGALSLSGHLRHCLQMILHPDVCIFMLADRSGPEGDARERKRRLNIRYRIRHKLNLGSRLEYSILLSLILRHGPVN